MRKSERERSSEGEEKKLRRTVRRPGARTYIYIYIIRYGMRAPDPFRQGVWSSGVARVNSALGYVMTNLAAVSLTLFVFFFLRQLQLPLHCALAIRAYTCLELATLRHRRRLRGLRHSSLNARKREVYGRVSRIIGRYLHRGASSTAISPTSVKRMLMKGIIIITDNCI